MMCRAIPYEGKEPYIFVSYSHQDRQRLAPIFEQMVLDGYRMWYDDGNHAGDDWLDNIEEHLEECSAVVAFISDNSSLSHNCKSELVYALKCKKKVIPVLIETTDLPKGLRMQMAHLHYLKSIDFPSDRAMLAKIWEAEECARCKAPAGTLKLREIDRVDPDPVWEKKEIVFDWNKVKQHQDDRDDDKPNEQNKSKAPEEQKEEAPQKNPPEKKPKILKVTVKKKTTTFSNFRKQSQKECSEEPPVEEAKEEIEEQIREAVVQVPEVPVSEEKFVDLLTVIDNPDDDKTVINGYSPAEDKTQIPVSRELALLLYINQGRGFPLRKPQTKIGRSPIKSDIVIEGDPSVSKYHAEIIQYNQKCFLRDANSANGTRLNGHMLESGEQIQLQSNAVIRICEETFLLVIGDEARRHVGAGAVALLLNEEGSACRILEDDIMLLNRNNPWPDGTMSDTKIHRNAHARLERREDGVYLVDESPEISNGTHLNGNRVARGSASLLTSGDRVRLGDTTLEFANITL